MKKIYQKPETNLIVITPVQMIAGSNPEDGFKKDTANETDATEGNLSRRRRDIWEDEEDEDNY